VEINKNKTAFILLLGANISVIVYLLGLGYYNSLLLDDHLFFSSIERQGVVSFIIDMYNTWQGRFGSFMISSLIFKIASNVDNLIYVTIFQLIVGTLSVWLFLRLFLKSFNTTLLLLIASLSVNLSILSLFEFSTFFWVCATGYITLIFLTFLFIWVIFQNSLNSYIAYILIFILSIIIGGGAEIYTPLVIMCLGVYGLYTLHHEKLRNYLLKSQNIRLTIALALLCVFFIVQLVAPGNDIRMKSVTNIHPTGLQLIIRTTIEMSGFVFLIISKLGYYILSFLIFYWVGYIQFKYGIIYSFVYKLKFKHFIYSIFLLLLFFWIAIMPGVYAMNALMFPRSLSYVSFIMVFFFGGWGLVLGNKFNIERLAISFLWLTSTLIFVISILFCNMDFSKAKFYQTEINTRNEQLKDLQEKDFKGIATVKAITISPTISIFAKSFNYVFEGRLRPLKKKYFPYEIYSISPDYLDYRNQGLKDYLKLDFEIVESCNE